MVEVYGWSNCSMEEVTEVEEPRWNLECVNWGGIFLLK